MSLEPESTASGLLGLTGWPSVCFPGRVSLWRAGRWPKLGLSGGFGHRQLPVPTGVFPPSPTVRASGRSETSTESCILGVSDWEGLFLTVVGALFLHMRNKVQFSFSVLFEAGDPWRVSFPLQVRR